MRKLTIRAESWAFARPFAISRGSRTEVQVVVAEISDGSNIGSGECVPYPYYGESVEGVLELISTLEYRIAEGITRAELREVLPAGAARNAIDCALWDLEAKQSGRRAWELAGEPAPVATITAETIGIGSVEEMGAAAARLANSPLLKIKLDEHHVLERIEAIHKGAPNARMIIDPNEGWTFPQLVEWAPKLASMGVEMLEQPLPAGNDGELLAYQTPLTICADEACHALGDLESLRGKYQMINIKLDKTGGLTEALEMAHSATKMGFGIMIGCMVGTSLAMAPATLIARFARFVDLDGPLLLRDDRQPGLEFNNGMIYPPTHNVWG